MKTVDRSGAIGWILKVVVCWQRNQHKAAAFTTASCKIFDARQTIFFSLFFLIPHYHCCFLIFFSVLFSISLFVWWLILILDNDPIDVSPFCSTSIQILWPNSSWHAIPLTSLTESSQVKKAYQKARLCLHPDKLQQRGATLRQKYVAEKAFSILQVTVDFYR